MKEKLVPASALATDRPCVRPPQGELIEMALISEDKLFWAEMGSNEVDVLLTILFVSLKSTTCDLSYMLGRKWG